MLGWLGDDSTLASTSKRERRSGSRARAAGSTLIATSRSSLVSRARYTSLMPPARRGARISYGPSLVPGVISSALSLQTSEPVYRHVQRRRLGGGLGVGRGQKGSVVPLGMIEPPAVGPTSVVS